MSSPNLFFPSPNTKQFLQNKAFLFDSQSFNCDSPRNQSPFTPFGEEKGKFFPISSFAQEGNVFEGLWKEEKDVEECPHEKALTFADVDTDSTQESHDSQDLNLETHRSNSSCKILKRQSKWTDKDDSEILALVTKYGKKWNIIAKNFSKPRNAKQIRERFINHLDKSVNKAPFTPEEEAFVVKAFSRMGAKWTKIASMMPGRTENQIKNKFHLKLKHSMASISSDQQSENLGGFSGVESEIGLRRRLPFEFNAFDESLGKKIKLSYISEDIPTQISLDQISNFQVQGLNRLEKDELHFIKRSLSSCISLIDSQLSNLNERA